MRRCIALSVAAVVLLSGCSTKSPSAILSPSGATASYHWRSQALDLGTRATPDSIASIEVTSLSSLCYSYSVESEQRERTDLPPDIVALMASLSADAKAAITPPTQMGAMPGRVTLLDYAEAVQAAANELPPTVRALCELPRGERGSMDAYRRTVEPIAKRMEGSMALMRGGASARDSLSPEEDSAIAQAEEAYAGALALLEATRTAINRDRLVTHVEVERNAEAVEVEVVAEGRAGMPTAGDTLRSTFTVPVEVDRRFFMSAGFMLSGMDQHDFQRQNVPVVGVDSAREATYPDSTISTFVDRKRGSDFLAVAPAVLISYQLAAGVGFLPNTISGGLAQRAVNGESTTEYLIGAGWRLGERVLVNLVGHVGKIEQLLIGDESEVRGRPVPAAVTRESAVGTKWTVAPAVLFSWSP